MAKAPKPVSILVADELAELPELKELAEKGHVVVTFSQQDTPGEFPLGARMLADYDLILSKSACMYMDGMEKYLPEAIKGARVRRYGAKQLSLEA